MVKQTFLETISFKKHELKGISQNLKLNLIELTIQYVLDLDTDSEHYRGPNLKGEIFFVLENIVLRDIKCLEHFLKRYLLSDGIRLGVTGRNNIHKINCTFEYCQNEKMEKLSFQGEANDVEVFVEHNAFGKVDIVYENDFCGLYRLRIAPGAEIPKHMHKQMSESELVVTDGLNLQNQPVRSGTSIQWPREFPHCYQNTAQTDQLVICIDRPAFKPEDEILLAQEVKLPQLEESMKKNYW